MRIKVTAAALCPTRRVTKDGEVKLAILDHHENETIHRQSTLQFRPNILMWLGNFPARFPHVAPQYV
jgi:hypothetical protein